MLFAFFWKWSYLSLLSTFPNVVKLDVKNYNVVSTLPNVIHNNVERDNVDSALLDVVNSNYDIHNVVSTLIKRCPTPLRHINLKTTLKQRWNVYWYGKQPSQLVSEVLQITVLRILQAYMKEILQPAHILKITPSQIFPFEFCESFQTNFFTKHIRAIAFEARFRRSFSSVKSQLM